MDPFGLQPSSVFPLLMRVIVLSSWIVLAIMALVAA